ncbi:MAG: hypothetical protein M1833_001559 [Piccolia ochrophora]|nr:MAG: hypothetical protein M1833_001559 [Piccolia ochrophora]
MITLPLLTAYLSLLTLSTANLLAGTPQIYCPLNAGSWTEKSPLHGATHLAPHSSYAMCAASSALTPNAGCRCQATPTGGYTMRCVPADFARPADISDDYLYMVNECHGRCQCLLPGGVARGADPKSPATVSADYAAAQAALQGLHRGLDQGDDFGGSVLTRERGWVWWRTVGGGEAGSGSWESVEVGSEGGSGSGSASPSAE